MDHSKRQHPGRRNTDGQAALLDNPDIKILELAGNLLELSEDKRQAIGLYVQSLHRLLKLAEEIKPADS